MTDQKKNTGGKKKKAVKPSRPGGRKSTSSAGGQKKQQRGRPPKKSSNKPAKSQSRPKKSQGTSKRSQGRPKKSQGRPGKQQNNNPKKPQKAQNQTKGRPAKSQQDLVPPVRKRNISRDMQITAEQRIDPHFRKIVNAVEDIFRNEFFLEKDSSIVIAVSGGVDSVVLLDTMSYIADKLTYNLHIAHYNHGLRDDTADRDEKFVSLLAKKYDLPFQSSKGRVRQFAEKKSLSIEHAARILRYMFLERVARTSDSAFVATAHTSDDSAETFLMNLLRGSGLTGLSGIPSKRALGKNVTLIRPLIELTKEDIIKYAGIRKLKWQEDETNSLMYYTRNKVRHDLIPKLQKDFSPAIVQIINRTAKLIHGADEFINDYVKTQLVNIVIDKSSERFALSVPLIQTFPDFIQGEIIQNALQKHFQMQAVSMNDVDNILDLKESSVGSTYQIADQVVVLRDRKKLLFARKPAEEKYYKEIDKEGLFEIGEFKLELKKVTKRQVKFKDDSLTEYFDMELLPKKMYLRSWEPGDSFVPLGMDGRVKISDYLINQKVPLIDKPKIIVLATREDIIWVCGHRISDKFKVTDETTRYLRGKFSENQNGKK